MIFFVIFSYAFFRGAAVANGNLPYGWGAFFSHGMGVLDADLRRCPPTSGSKPSHSWVISPSH